MVPAHMDKSALTSFRTFSVFVPSTDFLPTGGVWVARDGVEDVGMVGGPKRASMGSLSQKDCIRWEAPG